MECTFQPEEKIVRFPTDVVGDNAIKNFMRRNRSVPKIVKVGVPSKKVGLEFKEMKKNVDQSQKIFESKKGKE